jgi:hypothetical protein
VLFLTRSVSIEFKNAVVMQGARARTTGLWHLDLSQQSPLYGSPPINMLLLLSTNGHKHKVASLNLHLSMPTTAPTAPQLHTCLMTVASVTPQVLVTFSHAVLFSPTLSTLVMALTKGLLPQMLGLTLVTLRKYPPDLAATIRS